MTSYIIFAKGGSKLIVYIDILLLENIIVNYFILFITSQTVRVKLNCIFGIMSAILGSLYVFTILINKLRYFSIFPLRLLFPFIMIFIAFRQKDIIFNIKTSLIFIFYSMLIAGMCYFIQNICATEYDCGTISNFTYKKLLLSLMIIYIFINRIIVFIRDRKEISQLIYSVDIIINKKRKRVSAFFDTGNELREPATNLPVLIVEKEVFSDIDLNQISKFYIPYKVVNGGNGQLEGFKPDYITVNFQGKVKKMQAIVACCDYKLTNMNDYDALLSRGIIF